MQQLTHEWSDRIWRRTLAVMAGGLVLFYMLCPVAPLRWADLYAAYGKTAIIAMAAIYFFRARLDGVVDRVRNVLCLRRRLRDFIHDRQLFCGMVFLYHLSERLFSRVFLRLAFFV